MDRDRVEEVVSKMLETAPEWWCNSLKRALDGRELNLMPASPLSFPPSRISSKLITQTLSLLMGSGYPKKSSLPFPSSSRGGINLVRSFCKKSMTREAVHRPKNCGDQSQALVGDICSVFGFINMRAFHRRRLRIF